MKPRTSVTKKVNKMNELQTSIAPTLQYAILCDAVTKDQLGKPIYIGVFNHLTKPSSLPQFIISVKWICGIGDHNFKFKILDPNLKVLHSTDNFPLQFKLKTDSIQREFTLINFTFSVSGVYWIEIILNNESYLSIPLPVYGVCS